MNDIDQTVLEATQALLAMRIGLRDKDYPLMRDAAANLVRSAGEAHGLAFRLAQSNLKAK